MAKREAKGAGARTSRLGELNALGEQPGVDAVGEVALRLLHQLAHDQHRRRGAVAGDIVLRRGNARDHHGRRVLDLHLIQEHQSVLGDLDVPGPRNEPSGQNYASSRRAGRGSGVGRVRSRA